MKGKGSRKQDPGGDIQRQVLPFQGKFERRQLPDRRTNNSTESIWSLMTSRRRVPDRRTGNIEIDWIAEGPVIPN